MRAAPAEAWADRIDAIARAIGISRIGNVTGFDRIGIPVWQAVRPMSRSLSVSQGKGLNRAQARLSAVLEALELHCGERCPPGDRTGTLTALGADWGRQGSDPHRIRDWIDGIDLLSGRRIPVPRSLVLLDMTGPAGDLDGCSDGMGAGGTRDEARLAGLCELIEREAHARWQARPRAERAATRLIPDTIDDPTAAQLIAMCTAAGCLPTIHDLSDEFGTAAFLCVLREAGSSDARRIAPAGGSGCHPDRSFALRRAILEAAQTRVTALAGAREDLSQAHYDDAGQLDLALAVEDALAGPPQRSFGTVPHASYTTAAQAIDALLRHLPGPVAAIDFAPPVAGVAVTRLIAPWQQVPRIARGPRAEPIDAASTGGRLIFVGPSAPALLAAPPPGIVTRPPARCGDVAAAIAGGASAIGLVDGVFGDAPSVWHKELLFAIEAGVPVLGAASLGAIRAAELRRFGMIGIGAVFEAYEAGRIARDDAVLVDHAPPALGCRPLSLALVDICATLRSITWPIGLARKLIRAAAALPVPERTWPAILSAVGVDDIALKARIAASAISVKQRDTAALVKAMMSDPMPAARIAPVPVTRFVAQFSPVRRV
ncbi:YcaO-like family protein [Sphingomonas sp. 1P06PA]|uniref:YcaO-like family protein n=1 Tax=Sphingomonas sp. 1P06PA TaxID=554121 RepID=UPI0039A58F67